METEDIVVGGMYRFQPSNKTYFVSVLSEKGVSIDTMTNNDRFVILQNLGYGPGVFNKESAEGGLCIYKVLTPEGKIGFVALWAREMIQEKEKE